MEVVMKTNGFHEYVLTEIKQTFMVLGMNRQTIQRQNTTTKCMSICTIQCQQQTDWH